MTRNRWLVFLLVIAALVLWAVSIVGRDWRSAILLTRRSPELEFLVPSRLEMPLSVLPTWISSLVTFLNLFVLGVVNLYLFPKRVRTMQQALTTPSKELFQIALVGFFFSLLGLAIVVGASLRRITFPLVVLTSLALIVLSLWGYLALAYALGRNLLVRAGWAGSSPVAAVFLGLLLVHPLVSLPFIGMVFIVLFVGIGLGVVITTRFGSNEPWNLTPLLKEEKE